MKKIILISSISIVLVCFISFLILSTHSVNAAGGEEKYVAAKSGINLRSGPTKSSSVVTLIPFGSRVTIEKSEGNEIFLDERYGKWVNVKFGNKTGWVFSGFLCDFKPDAIIKIAADYYRDEYRNSTLPKEFTNFKDSAVSIESILDNFIILKVPTTDGVSGEMERNNVVWGYDGKEKKFFEVHNVGRWNILHLLYLDKDKYPDMVVVHGCCNSIYVDIFLGRQNGFSKIFGGYSNDDWYMTIGSCGDMEFAYTNINYNEKTDDRTISFFRFNCNNGAVEQYGESKVFETEGIISSIDLKKMSIELIDKKDSKERSYKIYKPYASEDGESLNNLQMGDNVSFSYASIDGKRIVFSIQKHKGYQGSSKG